MIEKKAIDNGSEFPSMDWIKSIAEKSTTRRQFLKVIGAAGLVALAANAIGCSPDAVVVINSSDNPKLNTDDALNMIIGLPNRCVGCRRCEMACTEYNEGFSQPSLARLNIRRNYLYGPEGSRVGFEGQGLFGNFTVNQDTCRQCPHPTPCMMACPYDAIETVPPVNARVVNTDKCQGCRTCIDACPWGMITFNEVDKKATKCFLCNNDPQCVKQCPSGALQYVTWKDMSKDIPARWVIPAAIPQPTDVSCEDYGCHPNFETDTTSVS